MIETILAELENEMEIARRNYESSRSDYDAGVYYGLKIAIERISKVSV